MMALDEKTKRFRTHVVKEIYETEKDYTKKIRFFTHILEKARQKAMQDAAAKVETSFTDERIKTLFCNIEEIAAMHEDLIEVLDKTCASSLSYDTPIAGCYLVIRDRFGAYKMYGENNEQSQKVLYEFEEQPTVKAFFVAALLLGGHGDEDLSSYVFKPIQRICKYPLLFRELLKYTPQGHPDHENTKQALTMMREYCSVINEAKRRVEKLEKIADLQNTIEGWEGSNAVDTCNELVREGTLVKISAGNSQERMFYLFDNLLVYCKKSLINKSLSFRGRIPVENLDFESIEDGTSDFHTNGITVTNSWKVHNIAKNKWFVLYAKTAEDKQQWMEVLRKLKEKRKRLAAGIANDTHIVVMEKGRKIHDRLLVSKELLRDHKVMLRTYSLSFTGEELVQWLVANKEVADKDEGIIFGQALVESGVIHHVQDKHQFKIGDLVYRFRFDDRTFRAKYETADLVSRGLMLYARLHGQFNSLIRQEQNKCNISARKLLDWLLEEKDIESREEGVQLGQDLFATNVIRHVSDAQDFKDGKIHYRFTADDGHDGGDKKTQSRPEFSRFQLLVSSTFTIPYSQGGYGIELAGFDPIKIKSINAETQLLGAAAGQIIVAINRRYIMDSPLAEAQFLIDAQLKAKAPVHITVLKNNSLYVNLTPTETGMGFQLRGSAPVVVSEVDKDSITAQASIVPGCCILKVGDEDVLHSTHELVVASIKKCLAESKQKQGVAKVPLKVGFGRLEQFTAYRYDSTDEIPIEVFEWTLESPYTFLVPALLMKLYKEEAEQLHTDIQKAKVKDPKFNEYLSELKTLASNYKRTHSQLQVSARYPSYKPYGTMFYSTAVDQCPTNLHTVMLTVASPRPVHTHASEKAGEESEEASSTSNLMSTLKDHTNYYTTTMAIPAKEPAATLPKLKVPISAEQISAFQQAQDRRKMVAEVEKMMSSLVKQQEVINRLQGQLQGSQPEPVHIKDDHLAVQLRMSVLSAAAEMSFSFSGQNPWLEGVDDLTPNASPLNSPMLARRSRIDTVVNTRPMIKLAADELVKKITSYQQLLGEKRLLSILEGADPLAPRPHAEVITDLKHTLNEMTYEIEQDMECSLLTDIVKKYLDMVQQYHQELILCLKISVCLCDHLEVLQIMDKLFSHCLAAITSTFAHYLQAAVHRTLNPWAEYKSNEEGSELWLQLIVNRGLLVYLECTMMTEVAVGEIVSLRDMEAVLSQIRTIVFHVSETETDAELPVVSLSGNRAGVHVTISIPTFLHKQLPEAVFSAEGISVCPVLFNTSLFESEKKMEWETQLNSHAFTTLQDYYRSMRSFLLGRSRLTEDNDARVLAIARINRPLNAIDNLVRQLDVAIRNPLRPGVGQLAIASDLAMRLGALRINVCNTGCHRSQLSCSLSQAMTLARCHGLPPRLLRTAINTIRKDGSMVYVAKKNNVDVLNSSPKPPPRLYQLPPDLA